MDEQLPGILIIDDDLIFLERILDMLQDDFLCHSARSGKSGLEKFETLKDTNPLVICDVNLPDIIGFDICKSIKSQRPKTHVMMLTGYNDRELRMAGLNAYADNYVDKTLGNDEIKLIIRNAYNTIVPRAEIEPPDIEKNDLRPDQHLVEFETEVKNRILEYYRKPLAEREKRQLSIEGMAEHLNLTDRTFQRKMLKHTNSSYTTYLAQTRVEKSKELLGANFTITQISEILEYSSPSHYSREFKKHIGITPNKYKKNSFLLR